MIYQYFNDKYVKSRVYIKKIDETINYLLEEINHYYEKLIEMSRNNEYATRNLLDYLYHQNYDKQNYDAYKAFKLC